MSSFYGGPAGNSFTISEIFRNRIELDSDLNSKADSSITVGSYVVISYGKNTEAIENRRKDMDKYNEDYNGTLWQKIYMETVADSDSNLYIFIDQTVKGLGYKLITALVGPMPEIALMPKDEINPPLDADGLLVLDADETPSILLDMSNAENPRFTIGLPRNLVLSVLNNGIINNNIEPYIEYNDTNVNEPTLKLYLPRAKDVLLTEKTDENGLAAAGIRHLKANQKPTIEVDDNDPNILKLTFGIPVSQNINMGIVMPIDNGLIPNATLDNSDPDNPKLNLDLPRSLTISLLKKTDSNDLDEDGLKILNAGENPLLVLNTTDANNPKLILKLPQSLTFSLGETLVVGSTLLPQVNINNDNINNPILSFSLPRAPIIMFGTKLGEGEGIYILDENLHTGDLYVNTNKNYLYLVIQENENNVIVKYILDLSINLSIALEYTDEEENNSVYSTGYINELLSSEIAEIDKNKKTYTAEKINSLMQEYISWGSFDDLKQKEEIE